MFAFVPTLHEMRKRISNEDKKTILKYHREQLAQDPLHKQSETLKRFESEFGVTKSTLNRWLQEEIRLKKFHKSRISRSQTPEIQPHEVDNEIEREFDSRTYDMFIQTPSEVGPSKKDYPIKHLQMILSSILQHYTELKLTNIDASLNFDFVKMICNHTQSVFPQEKLPTAIEVFNVLSPDVINYLEYTIQQEMDTKHKYRTIGKETIRLEREFRSYDHSRIFQYVECTINLSDYLEVLGEDVRVKFNTREKRHLVTVCLAINFAGTEVLPPVIVTNFPLDDTNDHLFENKSGLMSHYAFTRYVTQLNMRFRNEKQKSVLVVDRTSNHFLANQYSHVKLVFNNLNNFPMNFGIQLLMVKTINLHILDYFQRKASLTYVPQIIKASINVVAHKFKTVATYKKFLQHCVKLCINEAFVSNYSKLIRTSTNSSFHFSNHSKCLVLKCHEDYVKTWLQGIKLQFQNVLHKTLPPVFVLDSTVKSNFVPQVQSSPEKPTLDIDEVLKIRSVLEKTGASPSKLAIFDQFYVSLTQNLRDLDDELDDWLSDNDVEFEDYTDTNSIVSNANLFTQNAIMNSPLIYNTTLPSPVLDRNTNSLTIDPIQLPHSTPMNKKDRTLSSASDTSQPTPRIHLNLRSESSQTPVAHNLSQFSEEVVESDPEMDSHFAYLSDISNNSDSLRRDKNEKYQIRDFDIGEELE